MPALHLLTGEYPPQRGGVGDHTRVVARALAAAGAETHVWAPVPADARGDDGGATVHRVPGFGREGRAALDEAFARWPEPRTLLVQYAPRAFGAHGMNVAFCRWVLARRRAGDDVRVLFHEPFFPFGWQRPQRNALAAVNRVMAALLLRAARRAYVSIPAWEKLLRPYAPRSLGAMEWLPIPSTIPVRDDAAATAAVRERFGGAQVVGHFGTYGEMIASRLTPALVAVLDDVSEARALLLGDGGPAFAAVLEAAHPRLRGRIVAPGFQAPAALSAHVAACDVMLQPYPDGASARRTTLMGALSHGVATVSNRGRFTESLWMGGPVPLAPADDARALAAEVCRLLREPERRARAAQEGRTFYRTHFSVERTVAALLREGADPLDS